MTGFTIPFSSQNVFQQMVFIRRADESLVEALVGDFQFSRMEAGEVQDGGLQIADAGFLFGDEVTKFVGFAVGHAPFDAAARHPDGVAVGVMIAAEEFGAVTFFVHRGASEFAAPDDQRFIEQAALFEVGDQGIHWTVDVFRFSGNAGDEVVARAGAVHVPAVIEQLNKTHAPFDHASGEQAVIRKRRRTARRAIEVVRFFGFTGEIDGFGDRHLHTEGKFVLVNAGQRFRIAELFEFEFIQRFERIQTAAADVAVDALGVRDVENRVTRGTALHALIHGGQEAAAPETFSAAGIAAAAEQDHEAGQIFVFGAETVGDPGTHRRTPETGRAGIEEQLGGRVVELIGVHRLDDGDVVGDVLEVRQEFAHPRSRFAALLEFVRRAQHFGMPFDEGEATPFQKGIGAGLHVAFDQLGFKVEQFLLRRGAGHVQKDDAFRFGGHAEFGGVRISAFGFIGRDTLVVSQQRAERHRTDAGGTLREEVAPRDGLQLLLV